MQRSASRVFDLIKSTGTPSGPAELSLSVFRMILNSSRVIVSARASKVGGISICLSSGTDGLSNFDLQKSSMVLSGSGSGGGLPKDPSKIAFMTFDGFSS